MLREITEFFTTPCVVVRVTRRDIERGDKGSPCGCPVARALQRATGNPTVTVGTYSFSLSNGRERKRFELGSNMKNFIEAFDKGITPLEPFKSEVFIPDDYLGYHEDRKEL